MTRKARKLALLIALFFVIEAAMILTLDHLIPAPQTANLYKHGNG